MKKLYFFFVITALISCDQDEPGSTTSTGSLPPVSAKAPDHLIFVWLENKNYNQIIGSASAPFINSLIQEGTLFTNMHALGHPSYPEYIRFFSGTSNGKKDDECISGKPYNNANLFTQLAAKGKTFAWYSEDLPAAGSDACYAGKYFERHNPTQCFSNVPAQANKPWSAFPADYKSLETVVCISPNVEHDMHDGSILKGDTWVKDNLGKLITWCKTNNSVFVIYFDEDHGSAINHIPVIAVGSPIKENFKDTVHYDHYNWTRTILELYGAEPIGNAKTKTMVKDCWK
ncbi:MAG TPA: alkaline phosphatase family protein [Bacteroidia bacterium]|jgi:acid phosphatase